LHVKGRIHNKCTRLETLVENTELELESSSIGTRMRLLTVAPKRHGNGYLIYYFLVQTNEICKRTKGIFKVK